MTQLSNPKYSVLMSVYKAENPAFLKQSIESILSQTAPCDDFVIVCDGPLTDELYNVLDSFNSNQINVIKFPQNEGLGTSLSKGISYCKNELIARMDSDDISSIDRMEKQLGAFINNPELAIISGTICEFTDDIHNIKGKRTLPSTNDEIKKFSRKRNPFNHPAVMFKKSAVLDAGNYSEDFHFFEDYYLWVRMLRKGFVGANLEDTLLYMRVDDNTMVRRGGFSYAKTMWKFHSWLKSIKWSSFWDFVSGALPHAIICVLPSGLRKLVYKIIH